MFLFPAGAFSLLLPRTRGGSSPLPDLLLYAPAYRGSPFPLSPPDPRRSKREVVRGLSRLPILSFWCWSYPGSATPEHPKAGCPDVKCTEDPGGLGRGGV